MPPPHRRLPGKTLTIISPSVVRLERSTRGWSQDDVANRVKSSQSTISKIENGRLVEVPEGLALALSKLYELHYSKLFALPAA